MLVETAADPTSGFPPLCIVTHDPSQATAQSGDAPKKFTSRHANAGGQQSCATRPFMDGGRLAVGGVPGR